MPIPNLVSQNVGVTSVDRSIEAPQWTPFGEATRVEGDTDTIVLTIANYLSGDVTAVAAEGSFNSNVFVLSGSNESLVITATPRASVTDDVQDSITIRATGQTSGGLTPTSDNSFTLTTLDKVEERIFWSGSPGRTVLENTTSTIGLSQYVKGIPDDDFDSISLVSTDPSSSYITVENGGTSMAQLQIVAPAVAATTNVAVTLRVTKSTAEPTSDDVSFVITILNTDAGMQPVDEGIIATWNMPDGIQTAATVQCTVSFSDVPTGTLVAGDLYTDGIAGATITSVTAGSTTTQTIANDASLLSDISLGNFTGERQLTFTTSASADAGTIAIAGEDEDGNSETETLTFSSAGDTQTTSNSYVRSGLTATPSTFTTGTVDVTYTDPATEYTIEVSIPEGSQGVLVVGITE